MGFARESQLSFWNGQDRKTFIFMEIWELHFRIASLLEKTWKRFIAETSEKEAQRERRVSVRTQSTVAAGKPGKK